MATLFLLYRDPPFIRLLYLLPLLVPPRICFVEHIHSNPTGLSRKFIGQISEGPSLSLSGEQLVRTIQEVWVRCVEGLGNVEVRVSSQVVLGRTLED